MNQVMRSLYAADAWLKSADALAVAHGLEQWIRSYLLQAHLAYKKESNMFSLIPKVHAIHEICEELRRQGQVSSWAMNPCLETCSLDEDFVGRAAVLTRSVSPRVIAKRSLQRYLAQINVLWARA